MNEMFPFKAEKKTKPVPQSRKSRSVLSCEEGDRDDLNNYRPISVISVIAKVFERIVYDQLHAYLEEHNIICKYQSGFRAYTQPSRLSLRPRTLGHTTLTAVKSMPLFS